MSSAAPLGAEDLLDVLNFVKHLRSLEARSVTDEVVEKCAGLQREARLAELVRVVISCLDDVFAKAKETDVQGLFHILASLLRDSDRDLALDLARRVAGDAETHTQARLKVLAVLYNPLPADSEQRGVVLETMVSYACRTSQLKVLAPFLRQLAAQIEGWGLPVARKREVLGRIGQLVAEAGDRDLAYGLRMSVLDSFGEGEASVPAARDAAIQCARTALTLPLSCKAAVLLSKRSIGQLKGDAEHGLLFEALELFAKGRVAEMERFQAAHPGFFAELGLPEEQAMEALRLLTLSAIAGEREVLTYAQVSEALRVPEDEVEYWAILAAKRGVLHAQLNQLERTIHSTCVSSHTLPSPQPPPANGFQ